MLHEKLLRLMDEKSQSLLNQDNEGYEQSSSDIVETIKVLRSDGLEIKDEIIADTLPLNGEELTSAVEMIFGS